LDGNCRGRVFEACAGVSPVTELLRSASAEQFIVISMAKCPSLMVGCLVVMVAYTLATQEVDYKAGEAVNVWQHGGHTPQLPSLAVLPENHLKSRYAGECAVDGYFLHDAYSFVMCSNGQAYIQPCAPGTRNNPARFHSGGHPYASSDFCNENLNDRGAGVPRHFSYGLDALPYGYLPVPYYGAAAGYHYSPFLSYGARYAYGSAIPFYAYYYY